MTERLVSSQVCYVAKAEVILIANEANKNQHSRSYGYFFKRSKGLKEQGLVWLKHA